AEAKRPGLLGRMIGRKAPPLEPGGVERDEVASQRIRPGLSVSWWSDGSASIEATTGAGVTEVHVPAAQVQATLNALGRLLATMTNGVAASGHHHAGQPFHWRHGWKPIDGAEKLTREEKKAAAEEARKARADAESAVLKD